MRKSLPLRHITRSIWLVLGGLILTGCMSQSPSDAVRQKLQTGYAALDEHQYDSAILASNEILAATPSGPGAPEALYLRGRSYEDRPKADAAAEAGDMQAARQAFVTALQMPLSPQLEGRLRAGVAVVAYCQDDYSTALAQWTQAYGMLDKAEDRSLTLYRIAQSNQRLGCWTEADEAFAAVEQLAAGSELAASARALVGVRGFYVQVSKSATPRDAQAVIAQLRQQGYAAATIRDPAGSACLYVRVGPLPDYAQAKAIKLRLLRLFPQATVVP